MSGTALKGCTIVPIEQGTPDWHDWRAKGIGASDAPTIMGENPWKLPHALRCERQDSTAKSANSNITSAMAKGIALEPEARAAYCQLRCVEVEPLCIENDALPWMRCSLDGICLKTGTTVEIKCGQSAYKYTYRKRRPPKYYYGQMQHIMAVTGLPHVDFFCYLPNHRPIVVECFRDNGYIDRLIKRETAFWKSISQT